METLEFLQNYFAAIKHVESQRGVVGYATRFHPWFRALQRNGLYGIDSQQVCTLARLAERVGRCGTLAPWVWQHEPAARFYPPWAQFRSFDKVWPVTSLHEFHTAPEAKEETPQAVETFLRRYKTALDKQRDWQHYKFEPLVWPTLDASLLDEGYDVIDLALHVFGTERLLSLLVAAEYRDPRLIHTLRTKFSGRGTPEAFLLVHCLRVLQPEMAKQAAFGVMIMNNDNALSTLQSLEYPDFVPMHLEHHHGPLPGLQLDPTNNLHFQLMFDRVFPAFYLQQIINHRKQCQVALVRTPQARAQLRTALLGTNPSHVLYVYADGEIRPVENPAPDAAQNRLMFMLAAMKADFSWQDLEETHESRDPYPPEKLRVSNYGFFQSYRVEGAGGATRQWTHTPYAGFTE